MGCLLSFVGLTRSLHDGAIVRWNPLSPPCSVSAAHVGRSIIDGWRGPRGFLIFKAVGLVREIEQWPLGLLSNSSRFHLSPESVMMVSCHL